MHVLEEVHLGGLSLLSNVWIYFWTYYWVVAFNRNRIHLKKILPVDNSTISLSPLSPKAITTTSYWYFRIIGTSNLALKSPMISAHCIGLYYNASTNYHRKTSTSSTSVTWGLDIRAYAWVSFRPYRLCNVYSYRRCTDRIDNIEHVPYMETISWNTVIHFLQYSISLSPYILSCLTNMSIPTTSIF